MLAFIVHILLAGLVYGQEESGREYWEKVARDDLENSLGVEQNLGTAKNVVIFIGDGMGPNTVTAARIYRAGESSYLSWERFPHLGAIKTYAANKQVPDSANTATAILTGVKNNYNTLGVDERVTFEDCTESLNKDTHLTSLATHAQAAGKSTGFVTTARVTHATPAAFYAHSASRYWECDSSIPKDIKDCKDIGRQLVEDLPGKNFNVILGGGIYMMRGNDSTPQYDPLDTYCLRTDGRDLIMDWVESKEKQGVTYAFVNNTKTLLKNSDVDYLLGVFSNNHMPLEHERDTSEEGAPSLRQMVTTALKVLNKNPKGFVLLVEGALIDLAHHIGKARKAIHEVLSLNDAVNGTLEFLQDAGILDDTLIIVTSDHSHTLTISGYPERGNNIFGIADLDLDGMPYTTLGYANSVLENYHYKVIDNKVSREDPSKVDTTSFDYGAQAGVLKDLNTHGGNDVFIYAKGPYAHLFHNMHEQNYIATVVKYAAKLGEFSNSV